MLITGVVVGWGLFVRAQRELVLSLRERAARLEAEQRLRVEQAREAERLRIAREMHDVLAHRVSLLSLHAGALEFRPDASAEEVAEAAGVIRASAHAALEELRDVIGVLREGTPASAPEPPQPTLAEIPALVEESRAAGMRVRWHIDVPGDAALPAAARAHRLPDRAGGPDQRAQARAGRRGRGHGHRRRRHRARRRGRQPRARSASPRPPRSPLPGAGTGLVGLAERVALAGGELDHGPDAAGDFVLRATLPWPRDRRPSASCSSTTTRSCARACG